MDELRRVIEEMRCAGFTGVAIARALAALHGQALKVGQFRELMADTLHWKPRHANTYYYTYYLPARRDHDVADRQLHDPTDVAPSSPDPFPVAVVRDTLQKATEAAVDWYVTRSTPIDRSRFLSRGGIDDAGRGAVYSYHAEGTEHEETVYVGITGNKVKSRLYTPTSPHARSAWWEEWEYMRFVPVETAGDRQVLEMLLIVGLAPSVNTRPSAIDVGQFLSD